MAELVRAAQLEPITREMALSFLNSWRPRRTVDAVGRLRAWICRHMGLVNEPVEILHAPVWMLAEIQAGRRVWGDCDDAAMLVGTLGLALGLPARFVAIRPAGSADYVHVFTELFFDQAWRPVDTTSRRQPPADWERMILEI